MPDPDSCKQNLVIISGVEGGQKILRFLQRRLRLPQPLLHRWLRTGQIRVNGRRCKPFDLLKAGDSLRLPPFTSKLLPADVLEPPNEPDLLPIIARHGDIWIFNKPSGLPVQPGTGHIDAISSRLAEYYKDSAFCPAPAHRLDKETSGILLAGASFAALQNLHAAFRTGLIHKEYLAWIQGNWTGEQYLEHWLEGKDHVVAHKSPGINRRLAKCQIRPIRVQENATLLQIRLLTGFKRQLRAQLAATGHPIIGDEKYGGKAGIGLKLHACRVILPDGAEFACLPAWQDEYAVNELPLPFEN